MGNIFEVCKIQVENPAIRHWDKWPHYNDECSSWYANVPVREKKIPPPKVEPTQGCLEAHTGIFHSGPL